MSNRRRLKPPASVAATGAAYRCSDCPSETGRPYRDRDGIWHVRILHEPGCPVLGGVTSPLADSLRAAAAAGGPVVILAAPGRSA